MTPRKRLLLLPAAAIFLLSCAPGGNKSTIVERQPDQIPDAAPESRAAGSKETRVEMVNVNIHLDPRLLLRIRHLSGKLLAAKKGVIPSFDDKLSYIIAVDAAEIAVNTASMSHMMNTYVFGQPDSPLKNLKLSIKDNQVKQEGTLKKGIGIPFEMLADMSPTPDGKVRIHPTETKAIHLPVKGLMKLFGIDMAKLINSKNSRGVTVDGNDIILDPSQALPPPRMQGRITAVRIQGDDIVQIFGAAKEAARKPSTSNYMWYRGGVLRFGRMTMTDTDMKLVDADPGDPFDFYPDHYKDHLVGGYSKTTASGGLIVYMPDFNKISKPLTPR